MGVFSELDLENQQTELDGHNSKAAEVQTLQAKLIQQHEQKKAAAASEAPSKEPAAKPVAKTEAEQEDPAAAETERRRQHEEAEAKRKAEWERQQEEKRAAETAALAKIEQMSETELVKASMERMKKETERLTRRNLKECVSEYVQTLCLSDPAFARMVMHPRKSMAHCLQFINRKAREYLLAEMKDNGMEAQPNGIYGGDGRRIPVMTGQRNISGMQTPKRMRSRRNRLFQNRIRVRQSNPSVSPKRRRQKLRQRLQNRSRSFKCRSRRNRPMKNSFLCLI